MLPLRKISQRIIDPIFYRKVFKNGLRKFRRFADVPTLSSVEELGSIRRAVVVIAHPDDETFCSGLISELVSRDCQVEVLCLTRGEGGPSGRWPRSELGQVRSEEMQNSCDILGVKKLTFLEHIDPVARQYRVFAPDVTRRVLARQIVPFIEGADLVISHGSSGEYWHAAHLLVHRAVSLAMVHLGSSGPVPGPAPGWITFLARNLDYRLPRLLNWDDEADLRIDFSCYFEKRLAALLSHDTQLEVFSRFAAGEPDDFVRITSIESYSVRRPVGS